jgi:signal transduction histidine kinase
LSTARAGPSSGSPAPEHAKRFVRGAGAAQGGAGLGLSIVDTLARCMGAKLVLFSPPDGRRNGFEARIVWQASLQ